MLQELSARLLLVYASNISLRYGLLALCVGCREGLVHDFDGLTKPFFRLVLEPTFVLPEQRFQVVSWLVRRGPVCHRGPACLICGCVCVDVITRVLSDHDIGNQH